MPSVLDQKFKITFTIPRKHEYAVQQYLEENVGGRNYFLRSRYGGKHWAIDRTSPSENINVSLDDKNLASFIALKFI